MTKYFCTQCWLEVAETATVCPHCGDDMAARRTGTDYVDKLITALRCPEPTTPIRAAWILGKRHEQRAVGVLREIARQTVDAFIVEAAIEALGKIGGPAARETLCQAAHHRSVRVRRMAGGWLRRQSNGEATQTAEGTHP